MTPDPLDQRVLDYLTTKAQRPLKLKEISRGLKIGERGYPELKKTLARMTDEGEIYKIKHQRYALPGQINLVVGRLDSTRKGAGFVVAEQPADTPDLFVPPHRLAGATHRDRVVARIERRRKDGSPEGCIIRVLQRARSDIVGTLRLSRRFGFVTPDNPRLAFDVFVPKDDAGEAAPGDKVVVTIDDWGDGSRSPEGRVTQVLGPPDAPGVDILSIIKTHGLEEEFPSEVEADAGAAAADFAREAKRRRDLRDLPAFTIDPTDAKDFDDALSVRRLGDDTFEVGIHIADVSYYVAPDTPVDLEARERATSVYLVDRVIPMLPERLSNDLCSLKPDEDRLTYSVILEIDRDAQVKRYEIAETIIRSRYRLTYQQAQALIHSQPEDTQHKDILFEIQTLWQLAKVLRDRRARRGSLDFDLPEACVELDAEGFPIDIKETVRLDSMRLIEEFMLLANETVASHAAGREIPLIYRVHDSPTSEKVDQIRGFVAALGYRLPSSNGSLKPKVMAELLEQVRGKREEELVNTVVLRSMRQARYEVENKGHFGLASEHYTHFTSPIRRYPDIAVHRMLKRAERGERWTKPDSRQPIINGLERTAEHASVQERLAVEAERDSVDLKKVEFMERHLGDIFKATVSGVTAFGFFVRLDDYFVEGLVHVNELSDDYYEYLENQYALIGRNRGRRFRLADPVKVRVAGVDKELRQIDFELVTDE